MRLISGGEENGDTQNQCYGTIIEELICSSRMTSEDCKQNKDRFAAKVS